MLAYHDAVRQTYRRRHRDPAARMPDTSGAHVHIAIAGAGLSGIGMAIALQQDGIDDFVILERADDLGGTWRDNTYPGCACDIPSVLYSFTDEQNPAGAGPSPARRRSRPTSRRSPRRHGSTRTYASATRCCRPTGTTTAERWEIETTGGHFTADVLISAIGALADPSIPDLPGLDRFEGKVFHSARWDHDHDLSGRRVAVIGTGASAIQFVPEIQPHVGRLHLFQRTPAVGAAARQSGSSRRRGGGALPRHPRLLGAARRAVFSLLEAFHFGFRHPAAMRAGGAARPRSHRAPGPGSRSCATG